MRASQEARICAHAGRGNHERRRTRGWPLATPDPPREQTPPRRASAARARGRASFAVCVAAASPPIARRPRQVQPGIFPVVPQPFVHYRGMINTE